jgi:hypothetical protein
MLKFLIEILKINKLSYQIAVILFKIAAATI